MSPWKLVDDVRERVRVIRDGLRTGPPAQACVSKGLPDY
jgi:hypothetical protein